MSNEETIMELMSRKIFQERERRVWTLVRRYLAALCPEDPEDVVNFLWSMGLELSIVISNAGSFAFIMRGKEVLDEERI